MSIEQSEVVVGYAEEQIVYFQGKQAYPISHTTLPSLTDFFAPVARG